ncbi:MAG: DEAD/DEAH box helicase [Solirubrobacterales bacterium]|nr:DEAD/DEAH box helicase [Solirubrobacterales bacterium]
MRDGRIIGSSSVPARPAHLEAMPTGLDLGFVAALASQGISQLYSHQAEALRASEDGNVILTTPTASGKSLAFNLPVLNGIAGDAKSRALYLYPTKALAQDQARALSRLGSPNVKPAIYDGDTPRDERPAIRRTSNLVLTNPDMLHIGIMPHHRGWGDFFANLDWVVVDEAHTYRGVFGSHVANVLRRLRRLAGAYGSDPRFMMASATIANPGDLAERLTGMPATLIENDGAPGAGREVRIWNPPLVNPAIGARRSALAEGADLLADLVASEVRTICFLKSRKGIELIRKFAADRLTEKGRPDLASRIAPYRAGYTPAQRREIEAKLVSGELLGVASTDALELGIDIGGLDAAICVTFPGTVAGLKQMWGRAGRRDRGLAVYIAGPDGLDQYFCRHPDEFLERPVEAAILDHLSPEIRDQHLVAAAYELPLTSEDEMFFGAGLEQAGQALVARGELRKAGKGLVPRRSGFAASSVSLRSSSIGGIAVIDRDSGEVIGTVETGRAFSTIHPGAVYMHLGTSWEVEQLDLGEGQAIVRKFDDDWYTRPRVETDIFIDRLLASSETCGVKLGFGEISVTDQVMAYQRILAADGEAFDMVDLDLPEQEFTTRGLWYEIPEDFIAGLALNEMLGALHATEHGQIAVLPLIAMCDRWDIGGLSTNLHMQTGTPTIFIYDGHPGGVGLTRRAFDLFPRLVGDALRLIRECPCDAGCPSCIQSPKCGNLNEPLFKAGAISLLESMSDGTGTGSA